MIAIGETTLGALGLPVGVRDSSPPADFGTYAHWVFQCALRAQFMTVLNDTQFIGWDQQAAVDREPDAAVFANAATMFASEQIARDTALKMAANAVPRLPRKSGNWMAEVHVQIPGFLGGHIDLLSEDLEDIVDLKTTGTAPTNGKMKPAHMWQLVAYAALVLHATGKLPKRACILYVHNRGEWVCRSNPIDFESEHGQYLVSSLFARLGYYANENSHRGAFSPSPGDDCDGDFCPYTTICRDKLIPKGTHISRIEEPPLLTVNPFEGTIHAL
jgi:hypothetical protein